VLGQWPVRERVGGRALLSVRRQLDRTSRPAQRLLRYHRTTTAHHSAVSQSHLSLSCAVPICSNNCTSPANGVCTAADTGVPHCQCLTGWTLGPDLDCSTRTSRHTRRLPDLWGWNFNDARVAMMQHTSNAPDEAECSAQPMASATAPRANARATKAGAASIAHIPTVPGTLHTIVLVCCFSHSVAN
jgi:hypothetical protein